MVLDTYAPLKRISKYNLKIKSKPWITLNLHKSTSVKKNYLKISLIRRTLKEEFHTNYKKYRNLLSTLMKKSNQTYYDKYFERSWNNINPLSTNPTKWSNTLKQFVGKLLMNCLSVFDYFVKLVLKGLKTHGKESNLLFREKM